MTFNLNDVETYLPYTKALKDFLAKYDDENQKDQMKFEDCGGRFDFDVSLERPTSLKLCELSNQVQKSPWT